MTETPRTRATPLTGPSRDNVADLIAALARHGRADPAIATHLSLTTAQVRGIRRDYDIPAGEQRWTKQQ